MLRDIASSHVSKNWQLSKNMDKNMKENGIKKESYTLDRVTLELVQNKIRQLRRTPSHHHAIYNSAIDEIDDEIEEMICDAAGPEYIYSDTSVWKDKTTQFADEEPGPSVERFIKTENMGDYTKIELSPFEVSSYALALRMASKHEEQNQFGNISLILWELANKIEYQKGFPVPTENSQLN